MGEDIKASQVTILHDQPRVSCINDNYCLNAPVCAQRLNRSSQTLNVNSLVADHVPFAIGQSQKKGLSPDIVQQKSLKYGIDVSCVD